jgi:hypothetical protein
LKITSFQLFKVVFVASRWYDIKHSKQIKIGADPFPPYQYYDESGSIRETDYEEIKAAQRHPAISAGLKEQLSEDLADFAE